jgi:hypothetical protein
MADALCAASRYNISTGDARVYTGDYSCYFNELVCLPLPCELDVVWDQPSWYVFETGGDQHHQTEIYFTKLSPHHPRSDKLAERYSNKTDKITTNQFLSWNPNIQGSCSGIARGQRVCKTYVPLPPQAHPKNPPTQPPTNPLHPLHQRPRRHPPPPQPHHHRPRPPQQQRRPPNLPHAHLPRPPHTKRHHPPLRALPPRRPRRRLRHRRPALRAYAGAVEGV